MNLIDKGTYEYKYESFHKIFLDGFLHNTSQTIKVGSVGSIDVLMLMIENHMDITWLNLHLHHKPSKKKICSGKVIEYGELVSKVRYLIIFIVRSGWYVTPVYGNIERVISLRNFIQSDI